MSFREVSEPLRRWAEAGEPAGLATLVRVERTAPRRPGARFAANGRGEVAGSISSGCVEGDLFERLQGLLAGGAPCLVHYGITDEMAAEVGLACGGEIDVFLARHDERDPAWRALRRAVEAGRPVVFCLGVGGSVQGRQLLLESDGSTAGTLGSSRRDEAVRRLARERFEHGGTSVLKLSDVEPEGEAGEVFLEAFLPPARVAIVGATPVAVALCHLASYAGYRVTVIDPRPAYAVASRFPEAEAVLEAWPDEALEKLPLDPYVDVVVLGHDRKLDVPALAAALRAGCRYVGQIGGRRTQRLRREALAELGFPPERAERIRGPVGIDIGAETPEEIALSILAEMIAVRRGKPPV